ncbi:formate dehydrogenase accessory sulfurtransferase FdhD [Flavicella sediminum]|uniref:formate dehydrogenase accessory sulfurtransferase FdhD n=1 Tax=Flavicella sediminum TaxID=2585141 RepID=UPI001124783E|nr:formate dehydrogenase accessory sulfurtransferase FdhD [Flavicella sediminum]
MQTSLYKGLKKQEQKSTVTDDFLVVEAPLEIQINNKPFTVVMRTPGNDEDLVRGLLFAEDIYKDPSEIQLNLIENKDNGFSKINATISEKKLGKGYLNKRSLLSVSSCGICGKQELEDFNTAKPSLKNKNKLDIKQLPFLFEIMRSKQRTFDLTGGSHAAVLFDKNYNFLTLKEDIGRHNAVDKCIGNLLATNNLKSAKFMLVSGRVSYEIITKAFFAKISTIVAVSACSSLAVDYAKEFGICLIGFSRNGKATIYAHPENVI